MPLTEIVRSKPSSSNGETLRRTVDSFRKNGVRKYVGFLMIGIAETTPWEKTKDPTPMSILPTVSYCLDSDSISTYKRHPECFALRQRAREHTEVHGKNADNCEQDHMGSIRSKRG